MAYVKVEPKKTFELYGGKIIIDFYEKSHKYVIRNMKWDPIKKRLVKTDNPKEFHRPISVTAATGMLDKSRPLMIWAGRLIASFLKRLVTLGEKISHQAIDQAIEQPSLKRDEGAGIGDLIHNYMEEYIAGKKPKMPQDEKALNGIMAIMDWIKKNHVEFIDSETIVYSIEDDYVGKKDGRVKLDWQGRKGIKKLFDFKSNNWSEDKETGERVSRLYPEQRYQTSGYKKADEEEKGKKLDEGRITIAIDKETGEFHVHDVETDKEGTYDPLAFEKDFACFRGLLALKRRDKELGGW